MSGDRLAHALTVDVEDWYHVENLRSRIPPEHWGEQEARLEGSTDTILSVLAEAGVRGTFFVLGAAAERHPAVVTRILDAGHEIGCHGWSHDLVYRQEPDLFRRETRRSKALLEDLTGRTVRGYRASTFSITDDSLWALPILAEEGFEYDSSIAPVRHDRYGIPSADPHPHVRPLDGGRSIVEFPVCFGRILGRRFPIGGGFFRLFPLGWTGGALRRYERSGWNGMIYLHPWEFDPGQPRIDGLSWSRRFRHYTGIASTTPKLLRLLRSFRFCTMGEILDARFA